MNIPEEAIEKAAGAIYELDDEYTPYLVARAALSAAAPMLMARAWDEGKDAVWLDENESRYFLSYDPNPYKEQP